jgi:hypothetical protein
VFVKIFLLGPESGMLSNTKRWKRVTPKSQYSPYICQGDIGFFRYKNKDYGQFLCCVQTFSKKIYAIPIKNLKSETLISALEKMVKVSHNKH